MSKEQNANILLKGCLKAGLPVRLSERDGKFICIVEQKWITVEADTLEDAILDACSKVLTGEG